MGEHNNNLDMDLCMHCREYCVREVKMKEASVIQQILGGIIVFIVFIIILYLYVGDIDAANDWGIVFFAGMALLCVYTIIESIAKLEVRIEVLEEQIKEVKI